MITAQPKIKQKYFCQVVPPRYQYTDNGFALVYNTVQRVRANSVHIENFSVYNQFENICGFYNKFMVFINNQNYILTLGSQYYNFWDITSLLGIIQTQLNLQIPLGTWTCALGGNSNRFTVISNNTYPFRFVFSSSWEYGQVLRYLGFSNDQESGFTSLQQSHQSYLNYNVQRTQNLNLQLKDTAQLTSDILGCVVQIPLNVSVGSQLFFQQPHPNYGLHILSNDPERAIPLYSLQIQLTDDNLNPVLIDGVRISATVVFQEYDSQ